MQPSARKPLRYLAAALVGTAASLVIAPALADKPLTVLDQPISTTVTAIPIDFDRENPERKEFGKLIFRGGLNLFAKSSYFGGYSALALDPSGTKLLAISDAGTWLKADLEYDGRALKGLGNVVLGPILGEDGKPLLSDQDRDSEGMTLAEGDPKQGDGLRLVRAQAQDRALSLNRRQIRSANRHGHFASGRETHGLKSRHRGACHDHGRQAQGDARRLLRETARQERQSHRLAHRWSLARNDRLDAHRRLRHHRRCSPPRWRPRDPRAAVPL